MYIKPVYIASVFLFHLVSGLVIPHSTANELNKRIINGFLMPQVFAPYVVSLLKKSDDGWFVCGGTIVSDQHIVTAAHCVIDSDGKGMPSANISIGYGSPDKDKQKSVSTTKVTVHPKYANGKDRNSNYDIAVLQIPKLTFNANTQRIPIFSGNIGPNQSLMATGWGGTEDTAIYNNILRGVIVITGDQADCNKLNSGFESNDGPQVCTLGKLTPNHSTCGGDSGTSVVISKNKKQMFVGLDSIAVYPSGGSCGVSTSGHFYVNPYYHIDFITTSTGLTKAYLTDESSAVAGTNDNADDSSSVVSDMESSINKDLVSSGSHTSSTKTSTVVMITKIVLQTPSHLPALPAY